MNRLAKPSNSAPSLDRESLVREAAYALYEQQGCVDGHELEHWIAAEALVDEKLTAKGSRPSRAKASDKAASTRAH